MSYRDLQYVAVSKLYEIIEPLPRTSGVKESLDMFYDVAVILSFVFSNIWNLIQLF
jgi:hypothetical protein